MDRRAELRRYVEDTRRNQRIFSLVLVPLVLLSLALVIRNGTLGIFAVIVVGIAAIAGHWVLYAHLASHHQQLDELARRAEPPQGPQTGGHRRWNRHVQPGGRSTALRSRS